MAELHAEHVSLFERERRLRVMSRSLASDLDEERVVELATRYVSELMDAPYARLWLAEADGGAVCAGAFGLEPQNPIGARLPPRSLVAASLQGEVISITDVGHSPLWSDNSFAERTGLRPPRWAD